MPQVTLQFFADAGPNTAGSDGAGASQAARLSDGDDATGIRFGVSLADSRFSINPDDLPSDIGVITQVTVNAREARLYTQERLNQYSAYIGAALLASFGVFEGSAPIADNAYNLFSIGESITAEDAPDLIIGFTGGLYSGDRLAITEGSVTLTYNLAESVDAPTKDSPGYATSGIAYGLGTNGVTIGFALDGIGMGSATSGTSPGYATTGTAEGLL